MAKDLKYWLAALGSTTAFCLASILYLDRPIARFVHDNLRQAEIFQASTLLPQPFVPACLIILLIIGGAGLGGFRLPAAWQTAGLASAATIWAISLKTALKFVFGRTWPETWINNESFIRDGVYQFQFFAGAPSHESFPSGHMAVMASVMVMIGLRHPKLWPFCGIAMVIVAAGLVGMNYHFLSDVAAGAFVGYTTSLMTDSMYRTPSVRRT